MTTQTAEQLQLRLAPHTWDDVPVRVAPGDSSKPFMVAILKKDDKGKPVVVTAVRSKEELVKTIRLFKAIHGREYFRALLKMCPDCSNYGYTAKNWICDCPAGEALWEYESQFEYDSGQIGSDPGPSIPCPQHDSA